MAKRTRGRQGSGGRGRSSRSVPLEVGQEVRDLHENKTGVVVDSACQYAHPKAQPVYNYLIRWQDGQVQAVTESAFGREFGLVTRD